MVATVSILPYQNIGHIFKGAKSVEIVENYLWFSLFPFYICRLHDSKYDVHGSKTEFVRKTNICVLLSLGFHDGHGNEANDSSFLFPFKNYTNANSLLIKTVIKTTLKDNHTNHNRFSSWYCFRCELCIQSVISLWC